IEAARAGGAEAIHPGYGFLAENANFAEQCEAAGLIFVGPTAEAMRLLGDKRAAKQLARRLGIPVVPGYDGPDQDPVTLDEAAGELGFPLMIKAAAGGGGRGMRLVQAAADFAAALESAQREAAAAFGDPTVLFERAIVSPRHVEFQILADHHGNVLHLGERECSVQRKHQKVIEESPSPVMTAGLRAEMGAAAVTLARAAGYRNAGPVEFLLAPTGEYYFLEVNTRLQVEHPVTEQVTGIDLVQEQLRIAAGEPLAVRQQEVVSRGHAIECRVYAEDPSRDYAPSIGALTVFAPPVGEGIRNEVGVEAGDEITPYYDSMIAKLIVSAPDRPMCIDRALAALRAYRVEGVATNLAELGEVLDSTAFRSGNIATDFLDRPTTTADTTAVLPDHVLIAAACWRVTALDLPASDPWKAGPWRHVGQGIVLRFLSGRRSGQAEDGPPAEERSGAAGAASDGPAAIHSSGMDIPVRAGKAGSWWIQLPAGEHGVECKRTGNRLLLREDARLWTVEGEETADAVYLTIDGARFVILKRPPPRVDQLRAGLENEQATTTLEAPMTGRVVKIAVREGETVRAGQIIAVIEAMKMEHAIAAPREGTIARILYQVGDVVQAGALLAAMEE
ncbi:MAG: acetyl/propionyl/methylcrotonyl-CoA carboxylase subunit alpha, partial [Chloroflexota bacterium]